MTAFCHRAKRKSALSLKAMPYLSYVCSLHWYFILKNKYDKKLGLDLCPISSLTEEVLILKGKHTVVKGGTDNSWKPRKVAECFSWTMLKKQGCWTVEMYLEFHYI